MHKPPEIPRPSTPSVPPFPAEHETYRSPNPVHPDHPRGGGDTLGPPHDVGYRPSRSPGISQRLGALGVPQASTTEPPEKPDVPIALVAPTEVDISTTEHVQKGPSTPPLAPEASPSTSEVPPIPADIRESVGNILQRRIVHSPGWTDADEADLHLKYGPPEDKRYVLTTAARGVAHATEQYSDEIAAFVGTPETSMSPRNFRVPATWIPEAISKSTTASLNQWLAVTTEHAPGVGTRAAQEIIQTLESRFEPRQFAEAVRLAEDRDPHAAQPTVTEMMYAATQLSEELARTISTHADDPTVLERFLSTPYVREFGSEQINHIVGRRIIDLGQSYDPENSQHAELTAAAQRAISEKSYIVSDDELRWLLRHDPLAALNTLQSTDPVLSTGMERTMAAYLGEIPPAERSETQQATLQAINELTETSPIGMMQRLNDQLTETGSIAPEDARKLLDLATNGPDVSAEAKRLIGGFLPLDKITALLTVAPNAVFGGDSEARALVIRRYAADGQLAKAQALIKDEYWGPSVDTAKNLLAIYDETNDTPTLEKAQQVIESLKSEGVLLHVAEHETILAQHMTAHKYGDQERIDATWRDMEVFLGPNIYEYIPGYERLVQAHLDVGNLEHAETHALQLKERLQREPAAEVAYDADNVLLRVAHAYQQQGRYDEVARIVRTNFLSANVERNTLKMALEVLAGRPLDTRAELHTLHINAFHELRRRY